MSQLLINHPLNHQLKIDFSVNPAVFAIEIPYGQKTITKTICAIDDTDWAGAWQKAEAILIDYMNTVNSTIQLGQILREKLRADLVDFVPIKSLVNCKSDEFELLVLTTDFNRSYSVVPAFEPIRICRLGEEDLYYEINGAGAFFYCAFRFNGRYINACLGYAEYLDWEKARTLAREFIVQFSLYFEMVGQNVLDDIGESDCLNFNFASADIFLHLASEQWCHYSGFDELHYDATGCW